MVKLIVVAALLVPSVAVAGWSVKPPPGWKRVSADTEKALVQRAQKGTGESVQVEVRQWQATLGDPERQLTGTLMIMPPDLNDESVQALADGLANASADSLAPHGFKVQPAKAPKVKAQGTAVRILEGRDLRIFVQTRVARTAKGAVHLLVAQCGEPVRQARCAQAMGSLSLFVR